MGRKKKGGNKEKEEPKAVVQEAGPSEVKQPPVEAKSPEGVSGQQPTAAQPTVGQGRGRGIGRGRGNVGRESSPGIPPQSSGQGQGHVQQQVTAPVAVEQQPQPSAWGQRPGQAVPQRGQQRPQQPQPGAWGQRPGQQGPPAGLPQQGLPPGVVQQGPQPVVWSQRPVQQAPPASHVQQGPPSSHVPQGFPPGYIPQQQGAPPGYIQQGAPPGHTQQGGQIPQGPPPGHIQQGYPPGQIPQGAPPGQMPQGPTPGHVQQASPDPAQQVSPVQQAPPPADDSQKKQKQPKRKPGLPGPSEPKQQPAPQHAGLGAGDATAQMKSLVIQDKISKTGVAGRRIPVLTNHFELTLGRVKKVVHYDVDFQPDTPKKLLKIAFQLFRAAYFPKSNPAFDGRKNAYSAKKLPFGSAVTGKVVVEEEGMRPREFTIKMQEVNMVDLETIQQFLKQAAGRHVMEPPMDALQAIDIVFRHSLMMQKIVVGRSFFSQPRGEMVNLGNGMEMYRGLFQAVTLGWKPYLNIDVANKAFPKFQAVISLIKELCPRSDPRQGLQYGDEEVFAKFVKGLRVEYNLPNKPSVKKRTRINGIGPAAERNKFDYKNDKGQVREITVQEYFRLVYGIQLQYPKLPCLWVGALQKEQKTYLPCEFCTILPSQAVQRKLDADQTREMIRQCATNTQVRKDSIKTLLTDVNYNADPTVNEFDLKVSNEFLKLDARVLPPPSLLYHNNARAEVRKGCWNAMHFLVGKPVNNWTILNLDNRTKQESLDKLASFLLNGSRNLGMQMNPPTKPFQEIRVFRNNRLSDDLTTYFKSKESMQIIFVVIPEGDKTYNYVKQAAELAVGSLTQCLKSSTVFKKLNPATIGNILLKVNAKLNGANHSLSKPPTIMSTPTMIMGADVTHPSPDARNIPSVAAVTASHEPKAFKYNICWRLQPPTEEVISDMENITLEHLRYFNKINKCWPQKIVFYRDGVSDGQFKQVLHEELMSIRRACGKINPAYKPSITFIVVQKRHHTRFFPANPRDSEDRNLNVPAGTCVDTEIVHPTRQNFFLVSHASIQGVAKPTKYVTLWDDNDFSNDDLESLTYQLCHMFARCTRSVSYPAPTYYAHLAAARAKVYIETMQLDMNNLPREQAKLQIKEQIVKELPMFFV